MVGNTTAVGLPTIRCCCSCYFGRPEPAAQHRAAPPAGRPAPPSTAQHRSPYENDVVVHDWAWGGGGTPPLCYEQIEIDQGPVHRALANLIWAQTV